VIQAFYSFSEVFQTAADNGGRAWTLPERAAISDDLRGTTDATGTELARELGAYFATPITPPSGATNPTRIDLLVEGYTDDRGNGFDPHFGLKTLRLLDDSTPVGSDREIAGAGERLPVGGSSAEAIASASFGVGDALFGLTPAEARSWLTEPAGVANIEATFAAFDELSVSPRQDHGLDWIGLQVVWEGEGDPAFVDMAAVERLLQGRFANVDPSVVRLVWPDEPNPKSSSIPWARWIAIDSADTGRSRGGREVDERTFTVSIELVAPKEATIARPNAIHAAESEIRKRLAYQGASELATTGHLVQTFGADFTQDRPTGKPLTIRSGAITIGGVVERVSGATLE
jgi:hypothetical protein